MRTIPNFVREYINSIETLVSPARHLAADSPHIITGGYGCTDPRRVHDGMIVTPELARAWREADLEAAAGAVERIFSGLQMSDGTFGALVDFGYNEGSHRLALPDCSITRHLRAGEHKAAADALLLYDYAAGKELWGLKLRREIERRWFLL